MPTGTPRSPGPPCVECKKPLFRKTKSGLCSQCYDRIWAEQRRRSLGTPERERYLNDMRERTKAARRTETPKQREIRLLKAKARRLQKAEDYYITSKIWAQKNPKRARAIKKRYSDRQTDVKFRRGSRVRYGIVPIRKVSKSNPQIETTAKIIFTEKSRCFVERLLDLHRGERVREWVSYRRLTLIWQAPPDPSPLDPTVR